MGCRRKADLPARRDGRGRGGAVRFAPWRRSRLPYIAESEAATVAALRADFNALLLALREAGLMREPSGDAP